jgi:methylated-DNA-[protein]-cysteine S-methyltransferase
MTDDIETSLREAAGRLPASPTPDLAGPADRAGLLDVAYTTMDSPIGPLLLAATPAGVVRIGFTLTEGDDRVLEDLARKVSPRVLEAPARLDGPRRELDEYFDGRRTTFEMDLDWLLIQGFSRRVLSYTYSVPYGSVTTYGRVAAEAGNAKASRAAGRALGSNPIPVVVPCHRVIASSGSLTGYGGGLDKKEWLLRLEGVIV